MADTTDAYSTNELTNVGVSFVAGKVGNCGDFESTETDYLYILEASASALDYNGNTDFTFACWYKLETAGSYQVLVSKYVTSVTRQYLFLGYNVDGTPDAANFVVSADGSTVTSLYNAALPTVSTWYFIVSWHNATTDSIYIQVDNGTIYRAAHSTGIYNSNSNFEIGGTPIGPLKYDGLIDELSTWNRVLTADERTYLYNSGTGRTYTGGKIQ